MCWAQNGAGNFVWAGEVMVRASGCCWGFSETRPRPLLSGTMLYTGQAVLVNLCMFCVGLLSVCLVDSGSLDPHDFASLSVLLLL